MTDAVNIPAPPESAQVPPDAPVASTVPPMADMAWKAVRSPRLGRVAMIAAIAVFVVSIAVAILLGAAAGPYSTRTDGGFNFHFNVGDPNPAINALATAMLLHVGLGTGVGLWALIQGIVATASNRGRRPGIVAIVVAGVAPILSLVIFFITTAASLPTT